MSSTVCVSVCLSVTLVDYNYIDGKTWKLIAWTISPKGIHLFPGEHGEFWGRLEVGCGKTACWRTKAAISLKRVKIEEKLLWKARVGVSRDCPFFRVPPIISGTGIAANFKFCTHIYRLDWHKSPLQFLRKVALGVVRESGTFSGPPYIGRISWSSVR